MPSRSGRRRAGVQHRRGVVGPRRGGDHDARDVAQDADRVVVVEVAAEALLVAVAGDPQHHRVARTAPARRTSATPLRRGAGPRRCADRRGTGSPGSAAARRRRPRARVRGSTARRAACRRPGPRRTPSAARASRRTRRPCGRRPHRTASPPGTTASTSPSARLMDWLRVSGSVSPASMCAAGQRPARQLARVREARSGAATASAESSCGRPATSRGDPHHLGALVLVELDHLVGVVARAEQESRRTEQWVELLVGQHLGRTPVRRLDVGPGVAEQPDGSQPEERRVAGCAVRRSPPRSPSSGSRRDRCRRHRSTGGRGAGRRPA